MDKIAYEADPVQGGFTVGRGCSENNFLLAAADQHHAKRGKTLFAVSHDLKKAFDSAPWTAVMEAMMDQVPRTHPNILRYVSKWIRDHRRQLRVPGAKSWIEVLRGVPQGGVLSPAPRQCQLRQASP